MQWTNGRQPVLSSEVVVEPRSLGMEVRQSRVQVREHSRLRIIKHR
jgi:hypothetical protein